MSETLLIQQSISINDQLELVLTQNANSYQAVLDDFNNASFVYISTYNISKNRNDLLDAIASLKKDTEVLLISNIPTRYNSYSRSQVEKSRDTIQAYLAKLAPDKLHSNAKTYFNFSNHSKIIMTDKIAYVGSGNFSDESNNNTECGIIIANPAIIQQVKDQFFNAIINQSQRYYGDKLSDLVIQLNFQLKNLLLLQKEILLRNDEAIKNILQKEYPFGPIEIKLKHVELLSLTTLIVEEIAKDIPDSFGLDKNINGVIEIGVQLRLYSDEETAIHSFSKYDVEEETLANFEDMGMLDDGENTEQILLLAQEDAFEKKNDLKDEILQPLIQLKDNLELYIKIYAPLVTIVKHKDSEQRAINNT